MSALYETSTGLQSGIVKSPLIETARRLTGVRHPSRLNPLVLMSDPARTPDIVALARALPTGSALIYRHFGTPGLETALREITRDRGVQFLIGADPDLAQACDADGVHFSRRRFGRAIRRWRAARPDWIITAPAVKGGPDGRPHDLLDGLFFSAVFASPSPSAGTPRGVEALEEFTRSVACPVFALGGITDANAARLQGTGIAGIAAIGGLAQPLRTLAMTTEPAKVDLTKTDPIVADENADKSTDKGRVTIGKEEGGERIRFTADVAGSSATGELTLRRVADGVWNANHTGVPSEIGGRGVGKALVAAMVEDARQQGYRVVPGCPFVAKLFERKPEWADGVAA